MKRQYKQMQFKLGEYNEEEGIFSGYGAIFENIDSGGDIIEPGAFTKTLAEGWERVKILALHNDCWLPVGRPLELREDTNGLFLNARVSDTSMGKDIKILLKDGVLNELSIGYDPVVFDYDSDGIRHLREVKLWEVSIVTWAMNPEATITGYKSMKEPIGLVKAFESELMREFKAGRKISKSRLKSLQDVSSSMKTAARTIDAVIKDAQGEEKRRPLTYSMKSAKTENQIEIYY